MALDTAQGAGEPVNRQLASAFECALMDIWSQVTRVALLNSASLMPRAALLRAFHSFLQLLQLPLHACIFEPRPFPSSNPPAMLYDPRHARALNAPLHDA
jgi:hypothetical protein